ncbi:MAG: cytochrome c3 family protein [Archaeoglobaceae archaeon]
MKRVMFILIAISLLGCVAEKEAIVEKLGVEKNVVLDCQCHEEPWKYKKHFANVTSCKSCHGNEIIVIHENLSDWKWKEVTEVSCTLCHDPSLLANHGGKCELCHKTISETHGKYLNKYIQHEVKS